MPNGCVFCGNPHFNFGDGDEGVEMWINEPNDGEHVIVVDPPYAWSIPINFCPFCGRKLDYILDDFEGLAQKYVALAISKED